MASTSTLAGRFVATPAARRCQGARIGAGPRPGMMASGRRAVPVAMAANDSRPMWLTGSAPPKWLDGSLPGDYGFDPLGLGQDAELRAWYVEAERMNGRWAMMAVAGILFTDAFNVGGVEWFEAGMQEYALNSYTLAGIEAIVLGHFEIKRYQGFLETGKSGLLDSYPWDPMGMASPEKQLKEVKNGRLAMVAFMGFCVQAIVTGKGPIDNLNAHLSSPFAQNIANNVGSMPAFTGN